MLAISAVMAVVILINVGIGRLAAPLDKRFWKWLNERWDDRRNR